MTAVPPQHASIARGMLLQHDRRRVAAALRKADVAHAFLKGVVVDAVFHDGRGVREVADLDVLIDRRDEVRAWRALDAIGYARWVIASHRATNDASKERTFRADGAFDLDLHVGLINAPPYRDFAEQALARRRTFPTTSGDVEALCVEDMIVHCGGNVGQDWDSAHAKLAGDIRLLVGRFDVDWEAVAQRARITRTTAPLWALLRVAGVAPPWVVDELAPSRVVQAALRALADAPPTSWRHRAASLHLLGTEWPLSGRALWPARAVARWARLRVADTLRAPRARREPRRLPTP